MTEAEKIQIEQEVEDGSCEFMHVHEEIVEKVEGVMPDEQQLLDLLAPSFLRYLETPLGSRFCMCSASRRCVSAILQRFCRWASPLFPISSES